MSINQSLENIIKSYKDNGFVEGIHYRVLEDENYKEVAFDNGNKLVTVSLLDLNSGKLQTISEDKIIKSFEVLRKLEERRSEFINNEMRTSKKYGDKKIELDKSLFASKMKQLIDLERAYKNIIKNTSDIQSLQPIEDSLSDVKKIKSQYLNGYKKQNNFPFYIGSLFKFNYRDNYDQTSHNLNELIKKEQLNDSDLKDVEYMTLLYIDTYKEELEKDDFYDENFDLNKETLEKIIKNSLIDKNILKIEGYSMSEKIEREELNEKPVPSENESTTKSVDENGKPVQFINNVDFLVNKIRAVSDWNFYKGLDIKFRNAKSDIKDEYNRKIEEGTPVVMLGERVIASYDKESRKLLNPLTDRNVNNEVSIHVKYLEYKKVSNRKKDFDNIYDLKQYLQSRFDVDVFQQRVDNPESKSYGKNFLKIGNEIVGETYQNSINVKYTVKLNDIYKAVKSYKDYKAAQEQAEKNRIIGIEPEKEPKNLYDVLKPLDDATKNIEEETRQLKELEKEIDDLDVSLSPKEKKPSLSQQMKELSNDVSEYNSEVSKFSKSYGDKSTSDKEDNSSKKKNK